MKNKNIIEEKISMIEKSIKECDNEILLDKLKVILKMMNDKKNGLISNNKRKHSDMDHKEKKYRVYLLKSKSGEIIYVGITSMTLRKRLSTGYSWLNIEEYDMILIEETDDPTRERFWIEKYTEQGHKLYNSQTPTDIERGAIKANNKKEYYKEYSKKYRKYVKNK